MANKSPIEWTNATWNPVVGCDIVSPGCTNCYAMGMAARIEAMAAGLGKETHYAGTTRKVKGKAVWTGKLVPAPEHILTEPLRWKTPRMVFVNSMSDLFHPSVPDWLIDRVFAVMALTPQHTYQILTKRSERMREYILRTEEQWHGNPNNFSDRFQAAMDWNYAWINDIDDMQWPLPNVWLGVSAERQQEADARVPDLLATPAAVRFVSAEPLLGPIDFSRWLKVIGRKPAAVGKSTSLNPFEITQPALDQIIVGGESGPDARPMHPDWARSIRDQCAAADVPFFFKQWGAWQLKPAANGDETWPSPWRGQNAPSEDDIAHMVRIGKKRAGRLLDGREHNDMPQPKEVPAL